MATPDLSDFFHRLTLGMAAKTLGNCTDRQLVERALAGRDTAAFQAIVHRHGAMVYRVCWRVLQHVQDAEDAFQATFLVLATKLRSLRQLASLGSWLHGVAYRLALKAKAQAAARRRHEYQAPLPEAILPDDLTWKELRSVLDAELSRLPDRWRLPLVLCYLEGQTQDEAANQLGWSKSTLRRRLEDARETLGSRLSKRDIHLPAACSAVLLADSLASAAPTPELVASTVEAVASVTAGKMAAGAVSANVAALTEGVLKAMFITKLKTAMAVLLVVITLGGALLTHHSAAGQPTKATTAVPVPRNDKDKAVDADDKKAAREQWGETVEGLRMSITASAPDKGGNVEFQVAFGNVGEQDVTLNLGMMLANGKPLRGGNALYPTNVRVNLTDGQGKIRELHLSEPNIGGRVDDYVVQLRIGSVYSLKFQLNQFWCPSTEEFTLELKPGKYQVSAQFEGGKAKYASGKFIMNYWEGKLVSNTLSLEK